MAVLRAISLAAELNDEASSSSLGSHKIFSSRVPAAWSSAFNLGFTKPPVRAIKRMFKTYADSREGSVQDDEEICHRHPPLQCTAPHAKSSK